MNKVLADILEKPIPKGLTIPKVKSLIQSVAKIDEEPKLVYSADGEKILNELNKYGAKDIPQNYRGVLLEHWLDLLSQTQETVTEIPQYKAQTTTTGLDLETKIEQADKRSQQNVDIRAREKQTVDDFIKNYQEKIKVVQSSQEEFKDKVVYAKIEVDPKDVVKLEQLETDKQEKIKHYEDLIKQEKFETARQELSIEIEQRAEKELLNQGITKDEIKRVAIETANEAIEILSHKEDTTYVSPSYQTAILATVATDSKIIPTVIKSKSAEELIKSSASNVAVFRIQPEVLTRSILTTAFGEQFSTIVLGIDPTKARVSLTETLPQNLTQDQLVEYREVRLSEVNNHQIDIYQGQINALNAISDKGREITTGYVQSNVTGFLSRKIEALPAGSVIKKLTSTPEMQAVLFAKFGVGNPVTWQYANPVLMRVMGQNQLAGAFFSGAGKALGKEFVKPVVGLATKEIAGQVAGKVVADAGTKATIGTGLAATITAAFSWTGPLAPVIGAIGAFISTSVIGEIIANLWSKFKTWWTKNRDSLGPIFAVGAGTVGALLFGAGPGLGIGLVVAGATIGFGTLAVGAFGVLGFIGRSIGVAVATPVIVTLLVLPPLVAFIMLVINNSAYVVPYSSSDRSIGVKLGPTINGGVVSACTESEATGKDITNEMAARIKNGVVNLLPQTVWGRADGICIKPLMIIIHWSGGHDNDDGNLRTYETLIARKLSCQLATDTNDVWLMEKYFEKQVEFPACAGEWNTYSINNEVAGNNFTGSPPPPDLGELELAYDATCKIMEQYDIPWTKIYGHYQVPNSGKDDPGVDFLEKVFIPEIRKRCPNEIPKHGR